MESKTSYFNCCFLYYLLLYINGRPCFLDIFMEIGYYLLIRSNSELEWIHQDSKTWKVRGDNDYQYRKHVNCIYGIL